MVALGMCSRSYALDLAVHISSAASRSPLVSSGFPGEQSAQFGEEHGGDLGSSMLSKEC